MRRFLVAVSALVALVGLVVGDTLPAAAQDATPGAGAEQFPFSPDPAECTVEPRAADELLALWYGPDGSPVAAAATPAIEEVATEVTIPVGPPADGATAAAVADTVRQVFACFAAGETLRAYALFTDDLAREFGPEPGTPREEAEAFVAATPEPGAEGEAGEIVAITDVMDLADGRVGAFVVDRSAGPPDTVYAIFERDGDRLLVDEVVDFAPVGDGEGDEDDEDE